MERQFTATLYIVQEMQTLLLLHPKLHKWLPPGGHLEPNETPPEGALREAREETGLEIELINEEHVWVNCWNAASFERPFLCLLENIPPHNGYPPHQHVDFIYLGKPIGGSLTPEKAELRWFTLEEALALKTDEEIFDETQQTLRSIFTFLRGHAKK